MLARRQAILDFMSVAIEQPSVAYLLSVIRILIGLAVILAHNEWSSALAAVVTLIGYVTLLRGVGQLLLPSKVERKALTIFGRPWPYYLLSIAVLIFGIVLAFEAEHRITG